MLALLEMITISTSIATLIKMVTNNNKSMNPGSQVCKSIALGILVQGLEPPQGKGLGLSSIRDFHRLCSRAEMG